MNSITKTLLGNVDRLIRFLNEYKNASLNQNTIDEMNERLSGMLWEFDNLPLALPGHSVAIPGPKRPKILIRKKARQFDALEIIACNVEGWYLLALKDMVQDLNIDWDQVYQEDKA